MFKKLAADALGLSDIGTIIAPENYNKVDADDYILNEDGEKIYFVIKSKADEYCFTDRALIHVDGSNAISKKRLVKRFDYYTNPVSNVTLETAGTIDLDIEIKFSLGGNYYSIDVNKNQLEQLKDLYKALISIGKEIEEGHLYLNMSLEGLRTTSSTFGGVKLDKELNLTEDFKTLNEYVFANMKENRERFIKKNFASTFEKYINN